MNCRPAHTFAPTLRAGLVVIVTVAALGLAVFGEPGGSGLQPLATAFPVAQAGFAEAPALHD